MNKKHFEVVAAVIKKDNKVFCCQRANKGECALKWEFPGGKIESGETHEEAIIREIKEELNCLIKIKNFITTVRHEYNTFSLTMHVYLCELIEGEPILSEHVDSVWCDSNKLNELDFAEADYKFLDKIRKIIKALDDIDELRIALNDIKYFQDNSIEIYEKINNNKDYFYYIETMKDKLNMNGNNHFKVFDYKFKREIFKLLIASIELYIKKEIVYEK